MKKVGYYFNTEKAKEIRSVKSSRLMLMAVVGCAVAVIPTLFRLPLKFSVIGYIPYAFGLFALTLKNSSKSISKPIEFIGDELSLNIYIFHPLVNMIVGTAFSKALKINVVSGIFLWARPIIVLAVTIITAWIVYELTVSERKYIHSINELSIIKSRKNA